MPDLPAPSQLLHGMTVLAFVIQIAGSAIGQRASRYRSLTAGSFERGQSVLRSLTSISARSA
jgi:hypothetical protein